uniref:26S proteasome non-ATPase regulatory subunit 14 n=1 Tax=Arundo donax TaxID=35708 RepID=A0A0A9HXU7_ARUDO
MATPTLPLQTVPIVKLDETNYEEWVAYM